MKEHEEIRIILDGKTIPELIALTENSCDSCNLEEYDDCPGMEFCESHQEKGDINPVQARTELERRHKLLHIYIGDCRGTGSQKNVCYS